MEGNLISASPSEFSPKLYARIGGVLYLYIILAGIFVELFVRGKLVVSGDAAATASNLMAHEARWRVAFSAEVLWLACAVALTMIFYMLMRVVNRNIALMGAFFRTHVDRRGSHERCVSLRPCTHSRKRELFEGVRHATTACSSAPLGRIV